MLKILGKNWGAAVGGTLLGITHSSRFMSSKSNFFQVQRALRSRQMRLRLDTISFLVNLFELVVYLWTLLQMKVRSAKKQITSIISYCYSALLESILLNY